MFCCYFSYRAVVLIFTFFIYVSYHLSRKPISVVKVKPCLIYCSSSLILICNEIISPYCYNFDWKPACIVNTLFCSTNFNSKCCRAAVIFIYCFLVMLLLIFTCFRVFCIKRAMLHGQIVQEAGSHLVGQSCIIFIVV